MAVVKQDLGIVFDKEVLTKLKSIEAGAEVNVQPDWDETDSTKDSFIKNKPVGLTVVDIVESGNQNAVSSNAVATNLATVLEDYNKKTDAPYIVETGSNSVGSYRKWSDGTIEQWGVAEAGSSWGIRTIQLPVAYTLKYTVRVSGVTSSSDFSTSGFATFRGASRSMFCNKTLSSFGCQNYCETDWYTIGK